MQLWELYLLRSIQNGGQFNQRKSSNTSLVSKGEKKKRGNFLLNRFFINPNLKKHRENKKQRQDNSLTKQAQKNNHFQEDLPI